MPIISGAGAAVAPTGAAGGDLGGTYPNPTFDLTKAHVYSANQTAPALVASGLTGSVAASRYVGATASGAPTTGAHLLGDFIIDQTGKVYVCTTAGTPGTWTQVGGGAVSAHGFAATLGNDTSFNSGGTIVLDSVFHDTDSYYNTATGVATIPAGLGGLYLLSWYAETSDLSVTGIAIKALVSGAFDNVTGGTGALASTTDLAWGVVAYLSAGNSVHGVLAVSGAASATLVGNQTGFGLAYLGAA